MPAACAGHYQYAAVHMQHLHVVPVEPAEHLTSDDLGSRSARRPAAGHVDDAVHHREQGVHLVRRQQHGDLLLAGDSGQQGDDLLAAAQVEVGQRLVEQQQPGPADQCLGDEDPLLLSAGQRPDPGIGEPIGVNSMQHLPDGVVAVRRPQPESVPVPVSSQGH